MAALLASGGSGPSSAPPAGDTVAINFSRDVGWSGHEVAEIQRVGPSTWLTSYNHAGRPEIGVWQHPVAAQTFEELLASLRKSGYERLPGAPIVLPGQHAVVLGERKVGETVPELHSFITTVPPVLAPTVALIDAIRSSLQEHPLRVLKGELKSSAAVVNRGDRIAMELTLTNVGSAPLRSANPLARESGWNGLRLVLLRAGWDAQSIDLTASDISASGQSRSLVLSLNPGQSARFELHPKLDVPPGKYRVRFEYHSVITPEDDPHFVGGTLALPAGEIMVRRAAWWKVW